MQHDNTLLGTIRGALSKRAAYEVTPNGAGGYSYRDLGGAQPIVLGQTTPSGQSSYMRAFGSRPAVQSAMESLQARRELNSGTAFTPGYAGRVTAAGRSPESAQTRAHIQDVDRVAKKYGLSDYLRNQLYSRPQAFARFKRDAGITAQPMAQPAARTPAVTASPQTPVSAIAVTSTKTPASVTDRMNGMQTVDATPEVKGQQVTPANPQVSTGAPSAVQPARRYYHGAGVWKDTPVAQRQSAASIDAYRPSSPMTVAQMQHFAPNQPKEFYANATDYAAWSGNGSNQTNSRSSVAPVEVPKSPASKAYSDATRNYAAGDVTAGSRFNREQPQDTAPAGAGAGQVCPTCGQKKAAEARTVKTAGFWNWLQRRILLNGDVLNAGMKSMIPSGSAQVMVPDLFKPGTTGGEMRSIPELKRDFKNSAKAGLIAGTAYAGIPAGAGYGTAALMGGLGALGGANAFDRASDSARQAMTGDYGGAARSATEAVLSAGFGAAGKIPKAMTAAKGAAGLLAAADATRAGVYAANGMPGAAASAATGVIADSTMFLPGTGRLMSILRGVGLYGASPVAHTVEEGLADNALAGKEQTLYAPVAAKAESSMNDVLKSHGVDVKPWSDAIAGASQNAAIDAYIADTPAAEAAYAGRGKWRKFMSGILGTESLDAVKAREGLVPKGEKLTPGGTKAVEDITADTARMAPGLKAVQDYRRSWLGKLDRAAGWIGRHKGLAATGAAGSLLTGALIWRALANRRKRRKADELRKTAQSVTGYWMQPRTANPVSTPVRDRRDARAVYLRRHYLQPYLDAKDIPVDGYEDELNSAAMQLRLRELSPRPGDSATVDDLRRSGVIPDGVTVDTKSPLAKTYSGGAYNRGTNTIYIAPSPDGTVSRSFAAHEAGHSRQNQPGGLLHGDVSMKSLWFGSPRVGPNSTSPEVNSRAMYTNADGSPNLVALESDAWDRATGPYDPKIRRAATSTYKGGWINKYRRGFARWVAGRLPGGFWNSDHMGAARDATPGEVYTGDRYIRTHTPAQALAHLKRLATPESEFAYRTGLASQGVK